jgi:ribosomal protein L11 methyltransferase
MKWMKYRLKTTEEAEDLVSAALADLGIEGVQIEDLAPLSEEEKKQMFVDIPAELPPDDGIAYLSFYLDPEQDCDAILEKVKRELENLRTFTDIGAGTITVSETADVDWRNNWKKYFKPFCVDDLVVAPTWEEIPPEDAGKMVLRIDPGTAFGTGMHETTQLCIRALKKYMKKGARLLDAGTGSGILAIAAVKLGASSAVGTDLDPCTVDAVADNKAANGISDDQFRLIIGNLIDDADTQEAVGRGCYDIVTANILPDVLVPMMPAIASALKSGGVCILSGILDGKQEPVIRACEERGLHIAGTDSQGEWVSVIAVKP